MPQHTSTTARSFYMIVVYQLCSRNASGLKKGNPDRALRTTPCRGWGKGRLMRSVDEHGEAAGADDLFRAFMEAGKKHSGLVVTAADEAFDLGFGHLNPPGR